MYFVSNSSISWCLTLACLFTFCNSPKHFMKQIILFHHLLGFFFPVPYTFLAQILCLMEIKYRNHQGGTRTSLNRIWPAMQKLSWLFFSCTSEITGLLLWIAPLNTLVLSYWISFVQGFTAVFSLSFWQQHHLVLVNSLVITKFTLMERIMGINPLRKEDSWVEVSHTCGEQSSR